MKDVEARSDWVFGLSLIQVIASPVLRRDVDLCDTKWDVSGREPSTAFGETNHLRCQSWARLDAATEKNHALEQELGDMSALVGELKLMVDANSI